MTVLDLSLWRIPKTLHYQASLSTMETFIWKTVVSHRVYFIIKKKIVNTLNSSAAMKSYLLSCFIGFWRLRKSCIFHHYGEHFPFHLLLAKLLLGIQVYARYQKSVITSQCLCVNMSLSVKKEKILSANNQTFDNRFWESICVKKWRFQNWYSIFIMQPNLQR